MLAVLAAGCGGGPTPAAGDRLPVVATFSVLGDLVHNVGGEHVSVAVLAGPGIDTHTFAPAPADGVTLAHARLVFENGLGFEPWLDDLYQAAGSQATRVVLSEGIDVIAAEDGARDPHLWHSAANAIVMARSIGAALAAADPANAGSYRANTDAYTVELEALDDWIMAQVNRLPPERRKLVTTHDTFGYFAERYGFEVVGTLLPTTTEGASPSAQALAALVEAVRAEGVPAVFAETVSNNSLLDQVSTEAGVEVVTLYTDALGPAGSAGATYLDLMRSNVSAIVTALGS
jgi:ABC-type Zn uptake system ZnuABC Zn-binding protein ZnuA